MTQVRVAIPDMISPSYFPVIAAVELGYFAREGLDATLDLVFPVTETFRQLRDGELDFAAGSAHAPLYAFDDWAGCRLVCALSQHMYWFLVVGADHPGERGDLEAVRGLRIGAAPGPIDGIRQMLRVVGIDPESDVDLVPVPAAEGAGVSFGVSAAKALERGDVDAFWANGMGAEVAVRGGYGRVLLDARRGEGPPGAQDYTFAALAATEERIAGDPDQVAAAVRAVVAAQQALRADPSLAREAAAERFPAAERDLIAELIARDAPFYDPMISPASVAALNDFGRVMGILGASAADDRVADLRFLP